MVASARRALSALAKAVASADCGAGTASWPVDFEALFFDFLLLSPRRAPPNPTDNITVSSPLILPTRASPRAGGENYRPVVRTTSALLPVPFLSQSTTP